MPPLEGPARGCQLVPPHQPPGLRRLAEVVACQEAAVVSGTVAPTVALVLRCHRQVSEKLVVQELRLVPGPRVLEHAVRNVELAEAVSADKQGGALASCQAEVHLEEVGRLGAVAHD